MSTAKMLWLPLLALLMLGDLQQPMVVSAQDAEPVPYLLFTTQNSMHKLFLNGSTDVKTITASNAGNIEKIAYHYGMGHMFWIDGTRGRNRIVRANLNGTGATALLIGLSQPIDLTVDWLNNKLYWVDAQSRLIEEYDLVSARRRIVTSTGTSTASSPVALTIYPYPNYGWLYWSDSTNQSIQMISVTGDSRSMFRKNIECVNDLSIDYTTHILYCASRYGDIERLRLDADPSTYSHVVSSIAFFPAALTQYNNMLYYANSMGIYKYNLNGVSGEEQIYGSRTVRGTGVRVVHPSQQPPAETYIQTVTTVQGGFNFTCSSGCVNGNCIPPGLCACHSGWRGTLCATDIQECAMMNGGCEHSCLEREGSFECTCPDGHILADDGRSCVEGCSTAVVTVTATHPVTYAFDPCTTYITEATTSLVPSSTIVYTTSSILSTSSLTSTLIVSTEQPRTESSPVPSPSSSQATMLTSIETEPSSTSLVIPVPEMSSEAISSHQPSSTPTQTMVASSTPTDRKPRPSSTSTKESGEPTPVVAGPISTKDSDDEDDGVMFGLGLYAVIGIGGGLGVSLVIVIIALVVIIVLCVRYKRRRNRSWSPQKSFRDINIETMVAVKSSSSFTTNGHSNGNGNVVPVSKDEEAELDEEPLEYIEHNA